MNLHPPTVLLLDDDAQFRASLIPALEAHGLEVISANKGRMARSLVEEKKPDLLIVDGLLPDMNGIEWIESVRRDGVDTPILFVSAFYRDLQTFRHLTRDLKVTNVFHKPLAVSRFAREVAELITEGHDHAVPLARPKSDEEIPPGDDMEDVIFLEDDEAPRVPQVSEVKAEYARQLPSIAQDLSDSLYRMRDDSSRPSIVSDALRKAHDVHGTAGSYGYKNVSKAAGWIESELRRFQSSGVVNWTEMLVALSKVLRHSEMEPDSSDLESVWKPRISGVTAPPVPTSAATWLMNEPRQWSIGPKVLVLEDDPAMVAYLRSAVEDTLIHLDAAPTVEEALELAEKLHPSIVVIGWPLQRREDAPRFIRRLRKQPGSEDVRVLMVSVEEDPAIVRQAANWGVDLFLAQPIDDSMFQRAIAKLAKDQSLDAPRIAVLQDHDAVEKLAEEGVECCGYPELDELLNDAAVFRPHVILVGSRVTDVTTCRTIRMQAWDVDAPILVFGNRKRQEALDADGYLAHRGAWAPSVTRYTETIARLQGQTAACPDTGLFKTDIGFAGLESGLAAAQRQGRAYAVGLIAPLHAAEWSAEEARCVRKHLGRMIAGRFRQEDVKATWDSRGFVIGFDGPDTPTLMNVMKRLQAEAAEHSARRGHVELNSSIAVGLATYPLDGDSTRELLAAADQRAKRALDRDAAQPALKNAKGA